jgi:hypothetical protein
VTVSFIWGDSGPPLGGQIGGFRMEAPSMSPAPAVIGITSVAPKQAVMIDNLTKVILDGDADASMDRLAHPSHPSRLRTRRRTQARFRSADHRTRRCPPITCSTCRVTYLTVVGLPASVSPEGWVCGVCLGDLL